MKSSAMPKLQQVLESILSAMNSMYRRQFAYIPIKRLKVKKKILENHLPESLEEPY